MPPNPIVQTLDVLKDGLSSLLPTLEGAPLDPFAFERAEEALHGCVIITVAHLTHAHRNAQLCQPGQVSGASVGTAL